MKQDGRCWNSRLEDRLKVMPWQMRVSVVVETRANKQHNEIRLGKINISN